jgi:ribosomal protein S18 acetylase RimI-like enzyme
MPLTPEQIEAMRRGAEAPEIADALGADGAAQDLTAAFIADPLFDWFSRPDARRAEMRLAFFRFLMKELILGVGEVMRPAAGGAAAVWMPSESLGPNPIVKEIEALPMLLGLTGWSRFGRLLRLRDVMDAHHPTDRPHDYLWFLGVTPEAQGHGVGSRLIKARLDALDAKGRPAFLETATEANVRLYSRHGFEVIGEYLAPPDGPKNWAMWREPRAG